MALKDFFKKRRRLKIGIVLGLTAVLGFGGFKYYQKKKAVPDDDADIAVVTRGDLERTFQELGDLAAKNRVDVASKVSGRVIKLFVQEGDTVKKGERLAVIQPGRTGAEKFLPSTVVAPIAGVLLRYIKTKNTQPKFVEVGDYITGLFESQNPTYLMTVADMRTVIVELKINEMDILKLSENMPVDVTVDALPDEKFAAMVTMISPQAERENRGGKIFRVAVTLQKTEARLRSGMTARVKALIEKKTGVLKLPIAGLFEEKGVTLVYLENKGGKPKQTKIETGLRTETDIEITSGLKENDRVITEKPVEFEPLPKKGKKKDGSLSAKDAKQAQRKARRARRAVRKASR